MAQIDDERAALCISACEGLPDDLLEALNRDGGVAKLINFCSGITGAGELSDMFKLMLAHIEDTQRFAENIAKSLAKITEVDYGKPPSSLKEAGSKCSD